MLAAMTTVTLATSRAFAIYPPSAAFPAAAEDPVVDGAFSTAAEYANAHRVLDDLGVGYYYRQHRENWTVKGVTYTDTVTFFDVHYFFHSAYGQLDLYDMNSWDFKWGDTRIQVWVFLAGDHPDSDDWAWLNPSEIGATNYPAGYNDNGGFLVRLNGDPSTDRIWNVGDPEPGDPGWDFANYYGVFIQGGFNNSAHVNGYSTVTGHREIYEFSLTMYRFPSGPGGGDGGIPGIPRDIPGGDEDNPLPPGICDPIWEAVWDYEKVKDWKPSMGGFGRVGGTGYVPVIVDWVIIGWDDSMHQGPVPPPGDPFANEADGGNFVHFGAGSAAPPIPADFFGPGSDPFDGQVIFEGAPLDPDTLGNTATLLQRSEPHIGVVEAEIVALDLVSLHPITVSYGGIPTEDWEVRMSLSEEPPLGGFLASTMTQFNGGIFDAGLLVQPVYTFTRLSDMQTRELDSASAGWPPLDLQILSAPFVQELSPHLSEFIAPSEGVFVPAVLEQLPGALASQIPVPVPAIDASGAAGLSLFPASRPLLTVNELEYDQPGTDVSEFIEIYNPATTPMPLDGWSLEFFNGADSGNLYRIVDLSVMPSLEASEYLVVGSAIVPYVDLVAWTANGIQNGGTSPDGVALLWHGIVVEAFSYEGSGTNGFVAQGGAADGTFLPRIAVQDEDAHALQKIPNQGVWTETPNQTPGEANFLGRAPRGACCLGDGTCLPDATELDCHIAVGSWLGDGSQCLDTVEYVDCLTGPGEPMLENCSQWDEDNNGFVDLGDFALVQQHVCMDLLPTR